MTADTLAQVIYANLIEQGLPIAEFQAHMGHTAVGEGGIDLVAVANAILKAQSDEAAMTRVADPVSVEAFDKAVESDGRI